MPVSIPPQEAIDAILGATTDVTSRVEIFEEDGITPWKPGYEPELIDGTIDVSMDRTDRRNFSAVFGNEDGELDNFPGGFWYDKVFKFYRGVRWEAYDYSSLIPQTFEWETQVGEFQIDTIETPHFPKQVSVQGRDYTKRLQVSKLPFTTTFTADQKVEDVMHTLAVNGGVTKFALSGSTKTLGEDVTFDRGTERMQAISDLALAHSLEVYFDAAGYLTSHAYQDPVTSPEIYTFQTGDASNLSAFTKKASDSRIFNHVVISGEGTANELIGAEAINYEPTSPTRVQELGDRVYLETSPLVTTVAQAQELANTLLKIMALESFELALTGIVVSWLEVGYVVKFIDPDPNPGEPVRYLLTDFSIPLKLGQMGSTGKRVTIVG